MKLAGAPPQSGAVVRKVSGTVVVGLRPSLFVKGIALILRNDIAGGKVEANPCMSDAPNCDVSDPIEAVPGLFPACVVTCAMAQRAPNQPDNSDVEQWHKDETPDLSVPSSSTNLELVPETTQRSSKVE